MNGSACQQAQDVVGSSTPDQMPNSGQFLVDMCTQPTWWEVHGTQVIIFSVVAVVLAAAIPFFVHVYRTRGAV